MRRIQTGSRLHFGLIQPGAAEAGSPRFGGAGMMIDGPGVVVQAEPASAWASEGSFAERALSFASRFARMTAPHRLRVESAAVEHAGLGTGTQLGLAVATLLAPRDTPVEERAALAGRGRRSAIGIHGFAQGGFLIDGGVREPGTVAPLAARAEVPEGWRIVLLAPPGDRGWHGEREQAAFDRLCGPSPVERLRALAFEGLLPALAARDLQAFGEALHEYNARAGEAFVAAQGGLYAGPHVAATIAAVRALGVAGVGQTSWGPTVFALVEDPDQAAWLGQRCGSPPEALRIAAPLNRGASG